MNIFASSKIQRKRRKEHEEHRQKRLFFYSTFCAKIWNTSKKELKGLIEVGNWASIVLLAIKLCC